MNSALLGIGPGGVVMPFVERNSCKAAMASEVETKFGLQLGDGLLAGVLLAGLAFGVAGTAVLSVLTAVGWRVVLATSSFTRLVGVGFGGGGMGLEIAG